MDRKKIVILAKLHDCKGDESKNWFVFYSYRNSRSGKMVRFRVYEGLSNIYPKAERYKNAKKLIDKFNRKLKNGWDPFEDDKDIIYEDSIAYEFIAKKSGRKRKGNLTLNFYCSEFLNKLKYNIAGTTYQTYQSKLRLFNIFLEKKKIAENHVSYFDNKAAQGFIDYLFNEKKISNKTVNAYKELLKRVFAELIKSKKIAQNPFEDIQKYRTTTKPSKYFKPGTLELIKNKIKKTNTQLWLMCQFEFYTFIRPRELRFLKIGDLNLNDGVINVRAEISKNRKNQTVLIPRQFLNELIKLELNKYPDDYFLFSIKKHPAQKCVSKNYFWREFDKIRNELGISREYKLYSFKHTGAIMATKAGINLKDLQIQLRHHSLEMVDKYLKDMIGDESEDIRNKFPEL